MKRMHLLLGFCFLIFIFAFSYMMNFVPFYIEDHAYDTFTKELKKIKKTRVEKLTIHESEQGTLYQTKENNIFGYWNYDGFCVEQKYGSFTPVIKNKCHKETYDQAAKQVKKTSSKRELKNDTEKTGLDSSLPYSSKQYFVGENPSNYFYDQNVCYRIVSIAQNDTIKLVYEGLSKNERDCLDVSKNNSGSIALLSWDEDHTRQGNFENASHLKFRFDLYYVNGQIDTKAIQIPLSTAIMEPADWYIGKVNVANQSLKEDILNERSEISSKKLPIGLLNNSDYLKISCQTSSSNATKNCKNNNYLYKSNYQWWTINYGDEKNAWLVMPDGQMESNTIKYSWEYRFSGTRMSFYLKSDTMFIGTGTEKDPYRVLR